MKQVKVLGGLALADVSRSPEMNAFGWTLQFFQGEETDWKVLAIDVNDPLAPLVNCMTPPQPVWSLCSTDMAQRSRTSKSTALVSLRPIATGSP